MAVCAIYRRLSKMTIALLATSPISQAPLKLVNKIRAGMVAASGSNNAVEALPWLPPASINSAGNQVRANGTAYPFGLVYTNAAGTHMFVVRVAGTSDVSEPATITTPIVTTNPYNMGDITDGTTKVNWLGPVRTTTALADAPSVVAGALPTQTSRLWTYSPTSALSAPYSYFRFSGGTTAFAGSALNYFTYVVGSLQTTLNSNLGGASCFQNYGNFCNAVDFITDATLLCFDQKTNGSVGAGEGLNIEIDGRRLCDGGVLAVVSIAATNGYILLDFRATGIRKERHIRISCYRNAGNNFPSFGRLYTTPEDNIGAYSNPNRWRLACVGDSIFSGSGSGPMSARWDRASIFADLIGCDDVANLGVGGTGFIANNTGTALTYIQRIQDVITLAPDVVYIGGSFNDSANTATLQAAALLYYQTLRAALPNVMIVQAGTYAGVNPTNNQAIDAKLSAAVVQFADANTYFIPVSTDTPAWGAGTGYLGSTTGGGNSDIYIGPSDQTHPSQYAIASYLPFKDANAFRQLIYGLVG